MADIHIQPRTAFTGAYGGYGEYAGFQAVSADGTHAAKGGAAWQVGPYGTQRAGAGFAAVGPNGALAAGAGAVVRPNGNEIAGAGFVAANAEGAAGAGEGYVNNQKVEGAGEGAFQFNRATGDLDAAGQAAWVNKATGESHTGAAVADLTRGQGGTISVTKDGITQTYQVPPRPRLE